MKKTSLKDKDTTLMSVLQCHFKGKLQFSKGQAYL